MLIASLSGVVQVNAAISTSNVLTDLKIDENFNESDYPANGNDWSIYVIQIGESANKELYIYTYQPSNGSKDLIASSINISCSINENLSYKNYNLIFCNKSGVFNKYLVNGFVVKNDRLRYYDISEILRPFDEDLDVEQGHDNTISEVGLSVGQLWSACTINDEVNYCMVATDVVTITDKFVGHVRYYDGFNFFSVPYTESHFLAFSTDHEINKLEEAEIGFTTLKYSYIYAYDRYYYEDLENAIYHHEILKSSKIVSSHRIQTKKEFLSDENDILSDDAKSALENKQFVLRFYESDFIEYSPGDYLMHSAEGQYVYDVLLFRLKFETNGIAYNLGVVDSKQTGSLKPSGVDNGGLDDLWEAIEKLISIIILVIIIVVCWPAIITILPFMIKLLKYIFNGLLKILIAPFKLFKKKR